MQLIVKEEYSANSTDVKIEKSQFRFNSALVGGVLSLHWGTVTINTSECSNNSATDMMVCLSG